jgi:predicted nuclease with TOPRIM domain
VSKEEKRLDPALPAEPDDIESLKAENALLREKIAKLEEKAASLKKAILEIM